MRRVLEHWLCRVVMAIRPAFLKSIIILDKHQSTAHFLGHGERWTYLKGGGVKRAKERDVKSGQGQSSVGLPRQGRQRQASHTEHERLNEQGESVWILGMRCKSAGRRQVSEWSKLQHTWASPEVVDGGRSVQNRMQFAANRGVGTTCLP